MKTINPKNLIVTGRELRSRKARADSLNNKQYYTRVKCIYCESEGCKSCNYTGLIEIK